MSNSIVVFFNECSMHYILYSMQYRCVGTGRHSSCLLFNVSPVTDIEQAENSDTCRPPLSRDVATQSLCLQEGRNNKERLSSSVFPCRACELVRRQEGMARGSLFTPHWSVMGLFSLKPASLKLVLVKWVDNGLALCWTATHKWLYGKSCLQWLTVWFL